MTMIIMIDRHRGSESVMLVASRIWSGSLFLVNHPVYVSQQIIFCEDLYSGMVPRLLHSMT
jgi:hypothetical protein